MADDRPNYYAVLGVARSATPDELKRAYRQIAFACHPDRNPEDDAAARRFKSASEAYQVLSDPTTRERYDRGDDTGFFGASAARDIAARRIRSTVIDLLRNLHRTTQGGTNP